MKSNYLIAAMAAVLGASNPVYSRAQDNAWALRASAKYNHEVSAEKYSGEITFKDVNTQSQDFDLDARLSGVSIGMQTQKSGSPLFVGINLSQYSGEDSSSSPVVEEDGFVYNTVNSVQRTVGTVSLEAGLSKTFSPVRITGSAELGAYSLKEDFESVTGGAGEFAGQNVHIHSNYGSDYESNSWFVRLNAGVDFDISKCFGAENETVSIGASAGVSYFDFDKDKAEGQADGYMEINGQRMPPTNPGDSSPSSDRNDVEFSNVKSEVSAGVKIKFQGFLFFRLCLLTTDYR